MAETTSQSRVAGLLEKANPVKVKPIKWVEHKRYSDLIGIKGHKNYYVNLLSGKISYKHTDGKFIRTGKNTIMDAKRFVEETLKALATGKTIEKVRREMKGISSPLFHDLYMEAVKIKDVGKEKGTKYNYRKSWNHGLKFFWEDKTANDCTDSNIEAYKKAYLEKHPKRDFHHTGVHLGMALRYMLKNGYISKLPDMSPFADMDEIIKKNKKWVKPGRVYTPAEITSMKREARGIAVNTLHVGGASRHHKELLSSRAVLLLNLGLSGLRMKEACALEWEKMNFKTKTMEVWSFKNHKWRDVPMNNEVIEALEVQRKFTGHSKYVFPMPSDPERFVSNQVAEKVWWTVKEKAKISGWSEKNKARFHDLRHTFATITAEMGWPPKVACDVLDMSLEEYDKTYAKPSGSKKSEWMSKTWNLTSSEEAKKE